MLTRWASNQEEEGKKTMQERIFAAYIIGFLCGLLTSGILITMSLKVLWYAG